MSGLRRRPDSNRRSGFCRPLPYHLATSPHNLQESTRKRSYQDCIALSNQTGPGYASSGCYGMHTIEVYLFYDVFG